MGDLLVLSRYRFWKEGDHQLAFLAGIKLPTGNTRQKTNNGETVGTHNQPGSGSIDFQLGVAYTGHLSDDLIAVSADFIARINTEGTGEFQSGNSLQADLAFGYRPHASIVPLQELNAIFQERDVEKNEIKENSGVSSAFVSLGLRADVADHHSVFVVFSLPVWQSLRGIQNEEDYRIGIGYGMGLPK